jgi:DNA-binding transcriptional regulator YdaS (Cro superfamily)
MEILDRTFKENRGMISALSKHLGCSRSYVSNWRKVPIKHLKAVSDFINVSRQELRPDLYD